MLDGVCVFHLVVPPPSIKMACLDPLIDTSSLLDLVHFCARRDTNVGVDMHVFVACTPVKSRYDSEM